MPIIETSNIIAPCFGVDTPFRFAGAPVSGTSGTGAGQAPIGAQLINTLTGALFLNTGTVLSPTWTAQV